MPRVTAADPGRARALQALLAAETSEFRADDCWLAFLDYTIHHAANGVLDLSFRASGSGAYPSLQTAHVRIDLATLERIRASAAFSTRTLPELTNLVRRRVLAAWKASAKNHPEIFSTREAPEFRPEHLENFSVHADGVTFFFDFGLPHAVALATPESEYPFTRAEIRRFVEPRGPLRWLADAP
jgi:hypothetical protein